MALHRGLIASAVLIALTACTEKKPTKAPAPPTVETIAPKKTSEPAPETKAPETPKAPEAPKAEVPVEAPAKPEAPALKEAPAAVVLKAADGAEVAVKDPEAALSSLASGVKQSEPTSLAKGEPVPFKTEEGKEVLIKDPKAAFAQLWEAASKTRKAGEDIAIKVQGKDGEQSIVAKAGQSFDEVWQSLLRGEIPDAVKDLDADAMAKKAAEAKAKAAEAAKKASSLFGGGG